MDAEFESWLERQAHMDAEFESWLERQAQAMGLGIYTYRPYLLIAWRAGWTRAHADNTA